MDGSVRDIGLTGAGKGDAPRTKFDANWQRNFGKIDGLRHTQTIEASMYGSHFVQVKPGRWRRVFKA